MSELEKGIHDMLWTWSDEQMRERLTGTENQCIRQF